MFNNVFEHQREKEVRPERAALFSAAQKQKAPPDHWWGFA